jgi:hypothetical protein
MNRPAEQVAFAAVAAPAELAAQPVGLVVYLALPAAQPAATLQPAEPLAN